MGQWFFFWYLLCHWKCAGNIPSCLAMVKITYLFYMLSCFCFEFMIYHFKFDKESFFSFSNWKTLGLQETKEPKFQFPFWNKHTKLLDLTLISSQFLSTLIIEMLIILSLVVKVIHSLWSPSHLFGHSSGLCCWRINTRFSWKNAVSFICWVLALIKKFPVFQKFMVSLYILALIAIKLEGDFQGTVGSQQFNYWLIGWS